MAFGINDKVVETPATGFGVNDKVVETPPVSFGMSDTVVAKATAPAEKPSEDLTKPAFLAPRQRATALVARAEKIREEEAQKIPFDALWKDDKNFKTIQDYAAARFGKEGVPTAGETKEDFVKRFATHMRMLDTGNEINSVGELQYLNNAKQEDILKAGAAYDLFKNTAGVFDEKGRGQKGFRPILDVISSVVSSPSTALTLGTGKVASGAITKLIAEKGTKAALTSAKGVGMAAATPSVGGVTTAAQDVTSQKIELNVAQAELDQAKKIDPAILDATGQALLKTYIEDREKRLEEGVRGKQVALAGAIGAVTETAEVLPFLRGAVKGKTSQLDEILKSRKPAVGEAKTPAPKVEITPKDPTDKALEDAYDIYEGRKLLDAQGQPTSVAQMEVRNDLNKRATLIAQDIWKQIPEFAPQATEKVSDAIKRTLESVDTFDDIVFERALASADVTPDEFAKMFRTSAGDAARSLQSLSVVARLQNKLKNIDPAAASELNKMYGDRSAVTSAFTGVRDFGMRLDRELKALMVSQLSTTLRNAFSGVSVITFGTAAEAIESSLYRLGKTAGELATGKPVTGSFTGGLKGVYDDAVRSAFYLGQRDLSSEVTEALLNGTPALYRRMVKTTGEAGPNDLSKAAQIANTFNVAQDAFFRKAMFTSSVEKQLSRVGINMYDVIAQGKQVPFDVLQNAVNEALTGTFSKMPTKGPMFHAVKFIEELGPIGSTVIPFPRFMANAMEWTYKHMPTGVLSGSTDIAAGLTKMTKGEADMGTKQVIVGLENFSKGAVGTAALYAAYKYRQENQDTEWYNTKNPDGSTVDARALFPAAPFLALGDYLVKFQNGRTDEFKSKEFLEAMTGFKAPAGTYSWLGDKFAEAQSNAGTGEDTANNKVKTFFGEWVGEYLGRALVPFQQISDIIGAIDRNETLPRDAYQIPAGEEGFTSSATQQLMKRTPILKQELPVYQPPLRETAAFNDNGPLKMLSGIAIKGVPSELEGEVSRLKVPFNKIFTTTGDKIVDAEARKVMAPLVMEQFDNLKKTSFYTESSKDLQKIALQNLIGWAQKTAKEIATSKDEAAAFAAGKQPRLYEVQYSKLPAELKRVVVETYKQQQGKDLETTKDYASALAIAAAMRELPGYAKGGDVRELGKASLYENQMKKLTASKLKVISSEFREVFGRPFNPETDYKEAINLAKDTGLISSGYAAGGVVKMELGGVLAKKIIGESAEAGIKKGAMSLGDIVAKHSVSPAVEQTAQVLAAPVVKEGAASAMAKKPYIKNKYGPASSKPVEEVPMDLQAAQKPAPLDADMEKAVIEAEASFKPTPKEDDWWNTEPESPKPIPAKDPEFEIKEVEYDDEGFPIESGGKVTPPTKSLVQPRVSFSKIPEGNLNAQVGNGVSSTEARKAMLAKIRMDRQDAFDSLISMPEISKLPDAEDVMAVVQGDFRYTTGREINLNSAEDIQKAADMAKQYQDRLNKLREEYKDVPPIKLFHGRSTYKEGPSLRWKTGFDDPQFHGNAHSELHVGGTSFTRDINLNFESEAFGGTNPTKLVYTKIPYADYIFSRVPMSSKQYGIEDFNTIARSINGSERVVRPVSLSRSGSFKEAEDMITETDKLRPQGKATGRQLEVLSAAEEAKKALEGVPLVGEGKTPMFSKGRKESVGFTERVDKSKKIALNLFELNNVFTNAKTTEKDRIIAANQAYKNIKDYFNNALEYGSITSTKEGTGQRYHNFLRDVSEVIQAEDYPKTFESGNLAGQRRRVYTSKLLENTAEVLKANGSKEKAKLLLDLKNELGKFQYGNDLKKQINAVDNVRNLTRKFNKGGLASRR